MRDRALLHFGHLNAFKKFCEALGWKQEKVKGEFEVLRMRHPDQSEPMIVHARTRAAEHATVWGHSATLAAQYTAQPKSVRRRARQAAP